MRIKSLLIALALVASAVGAAQTARASFEQCPSNEVCLWGNNDFLWFIAHRSSGGGVAALTGEANNQMDSWGNRSTRNAAGYGNSNGTGDCQTFAAGSRDNNVAWFNSDEVSSWRTDRGC